MAKKICFRFVVANFVFVVVVVGCNVRESIRLLDRHSGYSTTTPIVTSRRIFHYYYVFLFYFSLFDDDDVVVTFDAFQVGAVVLKSDIKFYSILIIMDSSQEEPLRIISHKNFDFTFFSPSISAFVSISN